MLETWMAFFCGVGIGGGTMFALGANWARRQLEKIAGIQLAREDRGLQRLALDQQGKRDWYNSKKRDSGSSNGRTHDRVRAMVDNDGVVLDDA